MLSIKNIRLGADRTSMRLEPTFWNRLHEISLREGKSVHQLVQEIEVRRVESKLPLKRTEAVRVYVLDYFFQAATDVGHSSAGHGSLRPGCKVPNTGSVCHTIC